ncbi:MAG: RHS repeat protein [Desulfobacteraceae bacterium]|jgi:YD repeat-containing protein|nr:RHS repeat protein [Desulfobacteraceae bacterium]
MKYYFRAIDGLVGKGKMVFVAVAVSTLFCLGATTTNAAYTVNYSYDKAGRLTKASYEKANEINYSYDATGNLILTKLTGTTRFPWPMFLPAISNNATGSTPKAPLVLKNIDFQTVVEKKEVK